MKIAKPGETKEMYEKNFALLSPWLKTSISGISESDLWKKIEIHYNDEGCPVCRYRQGDLCFHITGEHPVQEAKAWYRSIRPSGSAEIFLYGTGFGYALSELFDNKLPNTLVIVYEQDLYLFKAMLCYFDLTSMIQTNKIAFLIGDCAYFSKAFQTLFFNMSFFGVTHPTVAFTLPAMRNFKKEYREIHRYVFKELCFLLSLIGNSHQDNLIGLQNMFSNAGIILENPYVSCLKDKYRNIPAFVVSNGPSLDRSIQKLKEIRGKALMICVESAIVPLTKNGISPDLLVVVERIETTYRYHFENRNYSPDISLLALAVADPRVFRTFCGEKIPIFRRGDDLNRWFNRNLGDGSELIAGANVAHLAAGTALYLGADPIVFVGQDYAYGPDGLTHSKDAVISQEKEKEARNQIYSVPTVYVEGNSGKMIASNRLWADCRQGLEHVIEQYPTRHFYNATDGGAKIRGTVRAELEQIIGRYCTRPIPYRVRELIAKNKATISAADRKIRLDHFTAEVEHYSAFFRSLANEINRKKLECEKMILLSVSEISDQEQNVLEEIYQKNLDSFSQYTEDRLCRVFFQQTNNAYFHLLDCFGSIDTPEKTAQAFGMQSRLFYDLRVICQSLSVVFEEAAESLRKSREKADEA